MEKFMFKLTYLANLADMGLDITVNDIESDPIKKSERLTSLFAALEDGITSIYNEMESM